MIIKIDGSYKTNQGQEVEILEVTDDKTYPVRYKIGDKNYAATIHGVHDINSGDADSCLNIIEDCDMQEMVSEFSILAGISQDLKQALKLGYYYKRSRVEKESMEMICKELAEICSKELQNKDAWIEIIKYANLALTTKED